MFDWLYGTFKKMMLYGIAGGRRPRFCIIESKFTTYNILKSVISGEFA